MPADCAIAVIPARGGSKRIPRKNIKPFLGVPLLARTVALLRGSEVFSRVIVSTDDDEVAAVAEATGAEVPFRRPVELANDHAATLPVIEHAVRTLMERGEAAELICCVYPAALFSTVADLRAAREMLNITDADYVFTATAFAHPIQRALRRSADGRCAMFWPEHGQARSQDLEPAFHDAGQFYFGRRAAWLEQRTLLTGNSRMLVVPHYRVQDIDTIEDWKRAEIVYELLQRD